MIDERQMSLFEEGGMTAPEVEVDAASGNEVPPGSLPEEVRDDVDAKLSGGEYVVSADVLRYYGMKFFEDLRAAAKKNLAEMDSEGRIGGEPMEDGEGASDGLSEQEMELLRQVMSEGGEQEFNQGGMVLRNPEFYGAEPQYAEGGMQPVQKFNPDSFRDVGSSYFNNQGSSQGIDVGSYYKTYVGPNGETRLILFVNGEPTTPIPEGFKEQTSAADKVQEEEAKEEVVRDNSESEQRARESQEEQERDTRDWAEKNYEALSSDPVAFGLDALKANDLVGRAGKGAGALGGALGLIGGGLAKGIQVNNLAQAKAAQEIAKASGLDTSLLDKAIEEQDKKLGFVDDIAAKFNIGTGSRYTQAYKDYASNLGSTQTEAAFSTTRSGSNTSTSSGRPTGSRGVNTGGGEDSNAGTSSTSRGSAGSRGVGQETASGNKAGAMTAAREAGVSASTAAGLSGEQMSNPGGFDKEEGNWASGPMNKGGLVKRRPKKTKK